MIVRLIVKAAALIVFCFSTSLEVSAAGPLVSDRSAADKITVSVSVRPKVANDAQRAAYKLSEVSQKAWQMCASTPVEGHRAHPQGLDVAKGIECALGFDSHSISVESGEGDREVFIKPI